MVSKSGKVGDFAGAAIEMRRSEKNRKHFDNCRAQGIFFQPLVVETFGGWDKEALPFLKKIAGHSNITFLIFIPFWALTADLEKGHRKK